MNLNNDSNGNFFAHFPDKQSIPVLTARQAYERLGKSRRQLYRYIKQGKIKTLGKFLGDWVLLQEEVERLAQYPLRRQPLPRHLTPLFPGSSLSRLNAGGDQTQLIARILDRGGEKALRWLFTHYRYDELLRFMRESAANNLSPRSLRLWSLFFRVEIAR